MTTHVPVEASSPDVVVVASLAAGPPGVFAVTEPRHDVWFSEDGRNWHTVEVEPSWL